MPARCLVLFTGSLDSRVALRLMQLAGCEVIAWTFRTPLRCGHEATEQDAAEFGLPLHITEAGDDYFTALRVPRFACSQAAKPCLDCRLAIFRAAEVKRKELNADFVATGEVLGQDPYQQKRFDLEVLAQHSGIGRLLLRPLSAKQLPATLPEQQGLVGQEFLQGIVGSGRRPIVELAKRLGLEKFPDPGRSCLLRDPHYCQEAQRLAVSLKLPSEVARWRLELLEVGRHETLPSGGLLVVGRNRAENERLRELQQRAMQNCELLEPASVPGPTILLLDHQQADLEIAQVHMRERTKAKKEI